MLSRCAAALLLNLVLLGHKEGLASAVIVPDDYPTVQQAIDSGADTVLVREGTYPERPLADRQLVLMGIGGRKRPRLDGLDLNNGHNIYSSFHVNVSRIDFTGRVEHTTIFDYPRLLRFNFSECSLYGGFYQVFAGDPYDVEELTFRNCRMSGQSYAQAARVTMEADTVTSGGVAWDTDEIASILDCWFGGGRGAAIELLRGTTISGATARNRIENHEVGISARHGPDSYVFEDNRITNCDIGIALATQAYVDVRRNVIKDCQIGLTITPGESNRITDNIILRSGDYGMYIGSARNIFIEGNVVGHCGSAGIHLELQVDPVVRRNTVFRNVGCGIEMIDHYSGSITVESNIGFENQAWGFAIPAQYIATLGCNDWFGNGLGSVSGVAEHPTDLNVDPLFCNVDSADVRLSSSSPLLGVPGCGPIGALGVGCGVTATLLRRFAAERVQDGIRVLWEVADGATASEVWLERSEGGIAGVWSRTVTERSNDAGAIAELDRSASVDRAYSYRLMAQEGQEAVILGQPVLVEAAPKPIFALTQVAPNPARGPLRIEFSLGSAAAIEIELFDVQGRSVASLGSGLWPAGNHVLEWDGLMRGGAVAPAGLYLVRYRYPGGQDIRRLVRSF